MNSKLTTNLQLPTTEPQTKQNRNENKPRKQLEQEENYRNEDHMDGYQVGRGKWENEGKGTGNRKHKWQVQNRQREVKNGMGNGEAKELLCMTHGHELRWGMLVGGAVQGRSE